MAESSAHRVLLEGLGWRHAIIPLAIVGSTAVAVATLAGLQATSPRLGSTSVVAGMVLLPAAPLALLALAGHRWRGVVALALVAGLLVLNLVSLSLPRVGFFADMDWNWQGKTLDLLWTLALLAMLGPALRREVGWTWQTRPGTLPVTLINIAILAVAGFLVFGDAEGQELTAERVLFDVTYPNLVEEIVFRGFMLALLDRAFPPRWSFAGARIGWGVVLTAWLFGLVHAVSLAPEGGLGFDPASLAVTFVAGLVLGWIRALTGSVWPAFLAHAAPEIGILLALALR